MFDQPWALRNKPLLSARIIVAVIALATTWAASPLQAQEQASVGATMGKVARQLFDLRPVPLKLDLPPFRTIDNGLGDCDHELRDHLIEAIRIAQADPDNVIVERRIDLRLPLARRDTSDAVAHIAGRYGADEQGRVWTEVRVIDQDQLVLAALPRSFVSGLVCKGVRRSLADTVDFAMRGSRHAGFSVALIRPDPRVGDLVSLTLQSAGPEASRLLCLNIGEANTAEVLTPMRSGAPSLASHGMLTWPRDFTVSGGPAGPICFEREQSDAIACFALPATLPQSLETRWRKAWPEGTEAPVELPSEATMELLGEALAAPGVMSSYLRYQVKRGIANRTSACGKPAGP